MKITFYMDNKKLKYTFYDTDAEVLDRYFVVPDIAWGIDPKDELPHIYKNLRYLGAFKPSILNYIATPWSFRCICKNNPKTFPKTIYALLSDKSAKKYAEEVKTRGVPVRTFIDETGRLKESAPVSKEVASHMNMLIDRDIKQIK